MTRLRDSSAVVYGVRDVAAPSAREAAEIDRAAREAGGVPERVLMENAGRAAALILHRLYPEGPVIGILGSGNNGGDGLVLLRTLRGWGRDVAWVAAGSREPDAALAHGHDIPRVAPEEADAALARAGVLVDAILGTGATGAPREPAAAWVRRIGASGRPVVALDLPSGVDSTTGRIVGDAVRAELTVCFGWPKQGLLLQPGRDACGRLVAVEIGFPPQSGPASAALITPDWARAALPRRGPSAHKNSEGRLLVLAGSTAMGGAAVLCAEAAVRAGAGVVRVATEPGVRAVLQSTVPEALVGDSTDAGELEAFVERSTAVVAGPGYGVGDAARATLERVLELTPGVPTLLDADALTLFAPRMDRLAELAAGRQVVLTPHPGEMARLSGEPVERITDEPIRTARELAERTGCVVLLKGAPSVIAAPGEAVLINTTGSSDAATAGMGDQLAGTLGAFLAGGAGARSAAALGLFFSGRAMELAGRGRALSPRDVSAHMAEAFQDPGPQTPPLGLPFVTFDQPPRH